MRERNSSPSPRQAKILDFIRGYTRDHGYPPAIREIGSAVGISSTSVVDYHLRALEKSKVIRRDSDVSRGITLVEGDADVTSRERAIRVPIMGQIAAGEPLDVLDAVEDQISLPPDLADEGCYALRVRGQSMIDDHIDDGDLVVIRPQDTAPNGSIVVALVTDRDSERGAATLKRLYREQGRVRLQPANASLDPIYVSPDSLLVQGVVRAIIRRY
jgi:repressor LexA